MRKISVEIKLSTTSPRRCLCKHCGKGPLFGIYTKNSSLFKNVKLTLDQFEYIRKNVKRMCNDEYLYGTPSKTKSNSGFSFSLSFKGYSPKLHRTRGASSRTNYTQYLICDCGRTSWAYNYKSTVDRKEITMRQASRNYKIIF